MTVSVSLNNLANGIRALSQSEPSGVEVSVEKYLEQELRDLPVEERLKMVDGLAGVFHDSGPGAEHKSDILPEDAVRFISLLLGEQIAGADLSPSETAEKFAQALDTIFSSLNQIIGVINVTLLGKEAEIETIRQVIGSQVAGEREGLSLKEYVEQIQQAFLTAHTSFQQAALKVVSEMLSALNPEVLEKSTNSSLKFGPLRKAELYDYYRDKYQECKNWFDSGRFSENMLREFEKNCHNHLNR